MGHSKTLLISAAALATTMLSTISTSGAVTKSSVQLDMFGEIFAGTCLGDDVHDVFNGYKLKIDQVGDTDNSSTKQHIARFVRQIESQTGCMPLTSSVLKAIAAISSDDTGANKLKFALETIDKADRTLISGKSIKAIASSALYKTEELTDAGIHVDTSTIGLIESLLSKTDDDSGSDGKTTSTGAKDRVESDRRRVEA